MSDGSVNPVSCTGSIPGTVESLHCHAEALTCCGVTGWPTKWRKELEGVECLEPGCWAVAGVGASSVVSISAGVGSVIVKELDNVAV